MTNLLVKKKNEVYVTIHSEEEHVHKELADYFTFEVPEAKYLKKNPRYKYWDGTIRLYSPGTGALYCGLTDRLDTEFNNRIGVAIDEEDIATQETTGRKYKIKTIIKVDSTVSILHIIWRDIYHCINNCLWTLTFLYKRG